MGIVSDQGLSERQPGSRVSLLRKSARFTIIAAALVSASIGAFQISRGAYRGSLAEHPDEAAHFVSGLCVLDYLRTGLGTNPVRFAESYYAHYPKVALGHWPPMFYVIQAAWYGLTGESAFQAILLAGIAAALTALTLLLSLKRLYGGVIALLVTAMFLWLPLVRASELMLMADMSASLFTLLAVLAFCDACIFERRKYWLLSGFWTVCAVLTKESALTLLFVIPAAAICLYGRMLRSSKRSSGVLLGASSTVVLLLLLYAAGGRLLLRSGPLPGGVRQAWHAIPQLLTLLTGASPAMFLVMAIAIAGPAMAGVSRSGERRVHVVTALTWLIVTLVSQLFFRGDFEPRYLLPAYVAAMFLAAEGLVLIQTRLVRTVEKPAIAALGIISLAGLCLVSTPPLKMHQRTGYGDIAAAIPGDPDGRVVLVSSDSRGEGAMIAQLLLEDPGRTGVVLRGTKVLSDSDWMGRDYRLLVQSPESVLDLLNSVPVHYVVVDMNGFIQEDTRAHHRLLEEAIRTNPGQFQLSGDFPLYVDGQRRDHAVQVYENLKARGRRAQAIHLNMTRSLGRDLDVRLTPRRRVASRPAARVSDRPARSQAATSFSIAPGSDRVPARGGVGRVYVTAPPSYPWSIRSVPGWIAIQNGAGTGDGIVTYEVAANRTNRPRTATLEVDGFSFSVTQPRSAIAYVPFSEDFAQPVKAIGALEPPDWNSTIDPPSQWVLDDQSGQGATVSRNEDYADGAGSLVLDKPRSESEAWKTQIDLSRIELLPGVQYRVAIRMKAEHSAPVWLTLRRGTPPNQGCGLSEALPVTTVWSGFEVTFRAEEACRGADNRLGLEAGKVAGRLWIAKLRFAESSQH